jgi:hypothetical protein
MLQISAIPAAKKIFFLARVICENEMIFKFSLKNLENWKRKRASYRNRTNDLLITSQLLYQLS